ncbi:transcription cofactor vestigial-like protein 3 isoform B [Patagioenas fasciata monilis]|uniref:Transcription cofactor vestigial-like protein 3 isoform B n=1 Tax=Patagioenas fasciata monilis TaxID=372326 RepID=A0A1V4J2U4_PATFA|nr:transcription cofactor vestigial-like protein 3 isoform B [Patagioenas fasciata monilis]
MSCSDVAMQQPAPAACGAPRYLAGAAAAPAAGCPQKKLAVYNKMQESLEVTLPSKQEEDEKDQPAEMEYLNSRCVLFTYFQGDIGSVVDEHFSRALSQVSSFSPETALTKSKAGLNPLWRESSSISSQRSSFPTSFWTSSYQPPPPPCLSGVHPDFPVTAPGTFPTPDPSSWPGHGLHQTAQPPPPATSESWHYPLASQCDVTKTDPAAVTSATSAWAGAFHGTVDIVPSFGFDTGLQHQDKSKEASWF